MRKKSVKASLLLAMGLSVATFVSCTHGENVYDNEAYFQNQAQQYAKKWQEKFGAIDPEQNWNMATQAKANIAVPSGSTVNVYKNNPLFNQETAIGSFTKSGEYNLDVPKSSASLYYETVNGDGTKTVRVSTLENGVFNIGGSNASYAKTRGSDGCNTTVGSSFDIEFDPYQDSNWNWVNKKATFYNLNNVATSAGSEWKVKDFRAILDVKDGKDGVFKEGVNNVTKWQSQLNFDIVYEMASDGPVTLDLNFRNTSSQDKIAYFYYTGNLDIDNVKKYIIVDNAAKSDLIKCKEWQDWTNSLSDWKDASSQISLSWANDENIFRGTRFNLVYFGADGNSEGTFTFPKGTKIGFCVIQNNYGANNNLVRYSIPSLNPQKEPSDKYVATFNYGTTTFLGFEDWKGDWNGDYDLNDVLFFATGNFTPPTNIGPDPDPDPVPEQTPQWIIACEDLGSTEDYDFNDIVFGVTHKAGETTATITPMAAGGVYKAEIYYNNELIGEIHELLGHSVKEDGKYPMINTGVTKDNGKTEKTITVPSDFTMSENMGGFNIKVTIPQEGEEATGLGGQAVRIWGTESGKAPQMFMLEGTWRWPKEKQNIEDAYPNFAKWNSNHQNVDWVNNPASGLVWE